MPKTKKSKPEPPLFKEGNKVIIKDCVLIEDLRALTIHFRQSGDIGTVKANVKNKNRYVEVEYIHTATKLTKDKQKVITGSEQVNHIHVQSLPEAFLELVTS